MRLTRPFASAAVLAVAVLAPAAPAAAAVPANDTVDGAVALHIGDTLTLDTTEATTDAVDKAYFQDCKPPSTDATVWYTFTSDTRTGVDIDAFESSYSVGMLVTTGTPGDLDTVLCGGGRFTAEAGVTYTIVLFDDQIGDKGRFDDSKGKRTDGGSLQISVKGSAPVPDADLTVDGDAVLNPDGSVTVTGTYWCTESEELSLFGGVDQTARGTKVTSFVSWDGEAVCDGAEHDWSLTAVPDEGAYKEATAASSWFALGCIDGGSYCSGQVVDTRLRLRATG